jgi:release factor glutamine methyltransferase
VNATVDSLLEEASRDLVDPLEARREAQILLGHALGVSRAWISANGDERADAPAAGVFRDLMRRRRSGAPIAYLVGKREFYGLDFRVTPDVLIPRADTEALVDAALQKLDRDNEHEVLDLGTGSGCVAITIAHERLRARVTAVDASPAALGVARDNAAAIGADVEFLHGSWFQPLGAKRFDLIVSNPPYVAAGDPHLLRGDLRFEPATALIAGKDGLIDIRRIVAGAPAHLRPGGWLLFEHGYDQADVCRDLLHDAGFDDVVSLADIAGLARVAGGRLLTPKSTNR